jgi:hypothetical protein
LDCAGETAKEIQSGSIVEPERVQATLPDHETVSLGFSISTLQPFKFIEDFKLEYLKVRKGGLPPLKLHQIPLSRKRLSNPTLRFCG